MPINTSIEQARRQLEAYDLASATLRQIDGGHINRTYLVTGARNAFVLQWVNPIFDAAIHDNIEAVTQCLVGAGVTTPTLVRTRANQLYTTAPDGGIWRLLTFIDGLTYFETRDPQLCFEAGHLAARFHSALLHLRHNFVGRRPAVHDTPAHVLGLRLAMQQHHDHAAYEQLAVTAAAVLQEAGALASFTGLVARPAHGDMKLSNVLFDAADHARAFVDLDTVAPMPWPIELGDALRSWCADGGENVPETSFSVERLEAALRGYAAGASGILSDAEIDALVPATHAICVELAARFTRDAFEESYFNWDRARYAAAWQHNLARATSQLRLARSLAAQRPRADTAVRRAFAG